MDVNQSVTFSVTASGGAGSLAYSWNGLPTGCSGSAASVTCQPQAAGSGFTITVTVTDGNDFNVTSAPVASFTVYADPTVSGPSATPSSVDAGQSVTISVVASSGAGGYSYVWSGLPAACGSPTTDSVTCTPTAAIASTSITVKVTDANGFAVTSEALVFTVFTDPSQASPTPSSSSADLGQTVTFTAVVSGGSGGGSYAWTATGLNCSATDGAVLSCTPTEAGSFSVSFQWTDSNGESATGTTSLAFAVYAVPTVTAIAPTDNNKSADVGQKVSFTATASGGPDGLTYTWTESSLEFNCTFGSGATASCTPKASGTYNLTVYVTDSNGVRSATVRSADFTVYVAPSVSVPQPSRSSSDVQQQVDFSVSASGGSGSPTYSWKYSPTTLGCMSGSTATLMCTPTVAGTYSVSVYVTDSNGVASPTESTTYSVEPAPSLTVPTFSTSRNVMDTNRTVTFTTTASGGSGAYTFTWTVVSGLGCTVADAASVACVPTVAGSYSVTVSAVDSNGAAANAQTLQTFTVFYAPAATPPLANRTSVDVNYTVSFNTTVSGGDGHLTYQWNDSDPSAMNCAPLSATDHLAILCLPRQAGTYTVWVNVTDTLGVVSPNAEVNFTVYSRPVVVLASEPHGSILQGHSVTFSASASGGYGNFTYSWGDLPSGCAPSHKTTITCTPTGSGTFVVIVSIQDANDGSSIANLTFVVNPAFLGLPAVEGYAIVGGIVVAAVVGAAVGIVLVARRHRGRRQETQF